MQTLMLETIVGKKPVLAPSGWSFDKTATIVWARLLHHTRELETTRYRTARDRLCEEARADVLALILANSIGMAPPYWIGEARACVAAGKSPA